MGYIIVGVLYLTLLISGVNYSILLAEEENCLIKGYSDTYVTWDRHVYCSGVRNGNTEVVRIK